LFVSSFKKNEYTYFNVPKEKKMKLRVGLSKPVSTIKPYKDIYEEQG
jgi:hypothetical protein